MYYVIEEICRDDMLFWFYCADNVGRFVMQILHDVYVYVLGNSEIFVK